MISASHNPWTDNGIKVFSGDGYKLPDARELAIEQEIFALLQSPEPRRHLQLNLSSSLPGEASLRRAYIEWLRRNVKTGPGPAESAGGLCQWRGGCGSAGAVPGLRDSGDVSQRVARWQEHQRECGALHPEAVAKAVAEKPASSTWVSPSRRCGSCPVQRCATGAWSMAMRYCCWRRAT